VKRYIVIISSKYCRDNMPTIDLASWEDESMEPVPTLFSEDIPISKEALASNPHTSRGI
jgi:hypothetical protein